MWLQHSFLLFDLSNIKKIWLKESTYHRVARSIYGLLLRQLLFEESNLEGNYVDDDVSNRVNVKARLVQIMHEKLFTYLPSIRCFDQRCLWSRMCTWMSPTTTQRHIFKARTNWLIVWFYWVQKFKILILKYTFHNIRNIYYSRGNAKCFFLVAYKKWMLEYFALHSELNIFLILECFTTKKVGSCNSQKIMIIGIKTVTIAISHGLVTVFEGWYLLW